MTSSPAPPLVDCRYFYFCNLRIEVNQRTNFQLHWSIFKFSMTSPRPVARQVDPWQRLTFQTIPLPSKIIHAEFHHHTTTRSGDMPCRLLQRRAPPPPLPRPIQSKHFWNLYTLPIVRAKFQVNPIIFNFERFSPPPLVCGGQKPTNYPPHKIQNGRHWFAKTPAP